MTPEAFRRLALELDGVEEGAHQGHADFRVNGRIFATLGSPDAAHAMTKLDPETQTLLIEAEPGIFRPANGAWGRAGSTLLRLETLDAATARSALAAAHAFSTSRPTTGRKPRPGKG